MNGRCISQTELAQSNRYFDGLVFSISGIDTIIHPCANAFSLAVSRARGRALDFGRVASQPRQASQIARGMALCAVR